MKIFLSACFFFATVFLACKNDETIFDYYSQHFYQQQEKLDHLVEALRSDSIFKGKTGEEFDWAIFNNTIRQKLKSVGIEKVYAFGSGNRSLQFDFKTNWRQENPIHITYNDYNSTETAKGFYRKDENENEVWGLGNNWTLWIERKLLDPKL